MMSQTGPTYTCPVLISVLWFSLSNFIYSVSHMIAKPSFFASFRSVRFTTITHVIVKAKMIGSAVKNVLVSHNGKKAIHFSWLGP